MVFIKVLITHKNNKNKCKLYTNESVVKWLLDNLITVSIVDNFSIYYFYNDKEVNFFKEILTKYEVSYE